MVRGISRLLMISAVLATTGGCYNSGDPAGPLRAIANQVIRATAQEISNPLRGQYEDMLLPVLTELAGALGLPASSPG